MSLSFGCFQLRWHIPDAQLNAKTFHITFKLTLILLKNQTHIPSTKYAFDDCLTGLMASPLSKHLECGGKRCLLSPSDAKVHGFLWPTQLPPLHSHYRHAKFRFYTTLPQISGPHHSLHTNQARVLIISPHDLQPSVYPV